MAADSADGLALEATVLIVAKWPETVTRRRQIYVRIMIGMRDVTGLRRGEIGKDETRNLTMIDTVEVEEATTMSDVG